MKVTFKLIKANTFQVLNPTNHGYLGQVQQVGNQWNYYLRGNENGFPNGTRETRELAAGDLYDLMCASVRQMQEAAKGQ